MIGGKHFGHRAIDALGRTVGRILGRRGRVLAVKWGLNPNSSSLGVDVTFLLFGAGVVALLTPVVGALLRRRKPNGPREDGDGPARKAA